ncbi:hypothetical protein B6N58_12885 [Legionella micdadei]|nr:hypothetical protein B6N58_12885 [Legionella micdadei]
MKLRATFLSCLIILCLVLLTLKPFCPFVDNNSLHSAHYSTTTSDCSSRTTTASYCQLSAFYTLAENELDAAPYLFIIAGALFFVLIQFFSNSPIFQPFKPPIPLKIRTNIVY